MTMGRAMSSKVRSAGPSLCWRSSSRIIVPSRAGWLTGGLSQRLDAGLWGNVRGIQIIEYNDNPVMMDT